MKPIGKFMVIPKLPPSLEKLRELAYNLRWSWNYDTIALFRRLDPDLWESSGHNPVRMLGIIDQARLEEAAVDDAFLNHLERVVEDFDDYMATRACWFRSSYGRGEIPLVAYFSAEFGLTESLSIFAGGLGVLAGDHLKSASDLGIPLVAVGLLYQQGYFRQYLNAAGWQQEAYEDNDFANLPLALERTQDGAPRMISVRLPGRDVQAQIWRVRVGRIPLFLLDANTPANPNPDDRDITDQLYGGDREMRLKQEILLGIGGYRALEALGYEPTVFHMNEGHSVFLALERVRRLMEKTGMSFHEARESVEPGHIFTTHTPVEAGHDYFPAGLMHQYFFEYAHGLGISWSEFMDLGHRRPSHDSEEFCMTSLALHLAPFSNAVSKLHGAVSRRMWQSMWPGAPADEIPIGHVTNGVHFQSWISPDMNQLYDRYLGPKWREESGDRALWRRVASIPAEELWRTHERRRERLVAFARGRLEEQMARRGVSEAEMDGAEDVLDSRVLTIGFARRFATYKRATLFLRDPARLARILNNPERPVQIIFAGKAHPRDDAGKQLIHQISNLIRQEQFRRHMVFLEDYDMTVARYLVQGADVWLNTPLRPNEACGTSGMKAAANGLLNLSTLDGWWAEAWCRKPDDCPFIGWAIGRGETHDDREYQDQSEAEALYELLEREVIPAFYDRRADGLPRRWVDHMKSVISGLSPTYNAHRMVKEYTERFYLPAHAKQAVLNADSASRARALAGWKARIFDAWTHVEVMAVENGVPEEIAVGSQVRVRARVRLGPLTPQDVSVELYLGKVSAHGEIVDAVSIAMKHLEADGDAHMFEAAHGPCTQSGLNGYTVRVVPYNPDITRPFPFGCITWAQG